MRIDHILGKYLLNKESNEELAHIETWKQESVDNLRHLQEMKDIWKVTEEMHDYHAYDVDEGLTRLERHMVAAESKRGISSRSKFYYWKYAAAACFAVLLVFSYYISSHSDGVEQRRYVSTDALEQIDLTDGTIIHLDAYSNLSHVPSEGAQDFDLNGRAFFDVAKQEQKRFQINVNRGVVVVVGTRFVIDNNEHSTTVSVDEGIVEYIAESSVYRLTAGDKLVHNADGIELRSIKTHNISSWMDQSLRFSNAPLSEVFTDLSTHFRQSLVWTSGTEESLDCTITSHFFQQSLADILEELTITIGLRYHIEDHQYIIDEIRC